MGKALPILNLQKISAIIPGLIDNYDSSDCRRSLFDLIYPRKSRDRTHISFLRQINSNPCLICLLTCLSPRQGLGSRVRFANTSLSLIAYEMRSKIYCAWPPNRLGGCYI